MRELLRICTTETPFRHVNGDLYFQNDGVSMGSPLGPLFADFYMAHVERKVLPSLPQDSKPLIYCRYVDDIFLMVDSADVLQNLRERFQDNSILSFTYEIEKHNLLTFLDVDVCRLNESFVTSVHVKNTNSGDCINYHSLAPDRKSVV